MGTGRNHIRQKGQGIALLVALIATFGALLLLTSQAHAAKASGHVRATTSSVALTKCILSTSHGTKSASASCRALLRHHAALLRKQALLRHKQALLRLAIRARAGSVIGSAVGTLTQGIQIAMTGPAYNLDQCANGPWSAPVTCDIGWSNQNLNEQHSHYAEGSTVPFRATLSGLTPGTSYIVQLQYDFIVSGKHAYDHIMSYNATETLPLNYPCAGGFCSGSPTASAAITYPAATIGPLASGAPTAQNIVGWGVSSMTMSYDSPVTSSTASPTIDVGFTATSASAVIAWGGHIASQADWGKGNSASAISGSPYHMRILGIGTSLGSLSGGNQDRSLKASAILQPPLIATQAELGTGGNAGKAHDTATVTPDPSVSAQSGNAPNGTITFWLCGPAGSAPDCSVLGSGTQIGSAVTLGPSGSLTQTATSGWTSSLAPGYYCFRAEFTPTGVEPYAFGTHTNRTIGINGECVKIKATPGLDTSASSSTINLGDSVTDTATFTPDITLGNVTGTVDFYVCGPTLSAANCTSGGTLVTSGVSVSSNSATSGSFTPAVKDGPGYYCFRAEYSGDANYAATSHTNSTTECVLVNAPDLTITKTADQATVNAGDTIGFTVTVSNSSATGTGTAYNVKLSDPLPAGVSWSLDKVDGAAFTNQFGCAIDGGGTLTCTIGDMVKGASHTFHVTATTSAQACGTYNNDATYTSDNGGTNDAKASIACYYDDLGVVKTADPTTPVANGDTINYTITVTNNGNRDVPIGDVVLNDTLTNVTAPTLVGNQTLISANGGTAVYTASYKVTAADCQGVTNTVAVSFAAESGNPAFKDAVSGNNESQVTTPVLCISLTKTAAEAASYTPGTPINYTITLTNTGSGTIQTGDIALVDDLDQSAHLVGTVISSVHADTTTLPPTLAPGDQLIYAASYTPKTDGTDCRDVTNTATVTLAPQQNSELFHYTRIVTQAQATVTVTCIPGLTITKTQTTPTPAGGFLAGQTINYNVVVTNTGTAIIPMSAITVTDPKSTGSATTPLTGGVQSVAGDDANLVPGETLTFTPSVTVNGQTDCQGIVNTATVTLALNGTTASQSSSAPTTGVTPVNCPPPPVTIQGTPSLTIKKTGPAIRKAGSLALYRITVTNQGTLAATNVVITDILPSGFTLPHSVAGATQSAGLITWNIGDLAAGASKTVGITVRIDGFLKTGKRCNVGAAIANNNGKVSAKACTRIIQVKGALKKPKVTG